MFEYNVRNISKLERNDEYDQASASYSLWLTTGNTFLSPSAVSSNSERPRL